MASDDGASDLVELRPAPAVLLRHRNADLDVVTAPRSGPRVELRRGALWVRAGEDGPGVTVTHGASSVQVRAGAGVVEVLDMEALLVVASGRAAVKGVSPLPRSVIAGQAITLTLDGTFTDPDSLTAAELAADRMVVENLALDSLASSASGTAPADPPLPTRTPKAAPEARVDPPGAPQVERTGDPFAPRVRPEPEPEPGPDLAPAAVVEAEAAPPAEVEPAPEVEPQAPPEPAPVLAPFGRPPPSAGGPSALDAALFGVGVTDTPLQPGETRIPVAPPEPEPEADAEPAPTGRKAKEPKQPKAKKPKKAKEPKERKAGRREASASGDDRRRHRILLAVVILAALILAIVAALAFNSDSSAAASLGAVPLVARRRPLVP